MLNFFKNIFKDKKKKYEYPYEFFIIRFNEIAKRYVIFEDLTKEIEYHNGNITRIFPYSDEKVEILHYENNVPYIDETTEEFKILISKKVNPQVIQYEEEV